MNNEATGLIDETQLKDLSFKIQVKQMPKKEGILLHEVITIDKFSALGEDDVQFTHFHVIYGSSSLGIFNAFGVDEVAGLKRKDCEDFLAKLKAQGKTERDGSFIAGLVNFVGDQIFMFFNVERLSFKGFAVRVLPHEALHLARVLITLYKNSWVRDNLNTPNWWEDPRSKFVDMNDDNEEFYAETLERCSAIAVDGWTRVTGTSCFAEGGVVEEESDVKKVLDSFSQSIGQGFYGAKKFVTKATAMPVVVKEQQSSSQNKMPAIMKTGGRLKYWKENEHRLSSPRSNIERELLVKAQYDDNDFAGNFGWMTPNKKYAEAYLIKLDDFDKQIISGLKLKEGEKIFRYINRSSAIGGMKPLIKINVEKSLLYFLESESANSGEIIFEKRGVKADFINLIEGKFAKGGRMEDYKGTITDDSAAHILKSLGFNFQYQHDSVTGTRFFGEFSKLKEAQNALYDTYRIETEIRGANKMGLKELIVPNQMVDFAKGGKITYFEYKGQSIMFEPHFKEYFVGDSQPFSSLEEAKAYIDSGSPKSDSMRGAYERGLFAKGGSVEGIYSSLAQFIKFNPTFTKKISEIYKISENDVEDNLYGEIDYDEEVLKNILGKEYRVFYNEKSDEFEISLKSKKKNVSYEIVLAKKDNEIKILNAILDQVYTEYPARFGVIVNGKIIGGSTFKIKNKTYFFDIGLSPKYQGLGISKPLIDKIIEDAKKSNSTRLEAEVVNPYLLSYLKSRGFLVYRNQEQDYATMDLTKYAKGGITQMPYYSNMTKQEILTKTVVYDNGGETLDRYTVFTPDGSVFGMSETAQGFNQYIGDDSEIEKGSHLGKRLKSVPKSIEWAVLDRMKENTFAKGGTPNKMVILKDKFQQRADEPHRVYHSIEGMLGDYWFTAKTDNSHKHGYGSDGIKGGCVYQLDVWRGGNPVGRDNSTKGGHVSEDYLAGYDNKWGNTRPRSKEAKQVVESIVNWLEKNICDLKREWSSVKFKTGGEIEDEKSTFVVLAVSDLGEETYTVEATDGVQAFHEVRYIFKKENPNYKGELSLSMVDKYAKGGQVKLSTDEKIQQMVDHILNEWDKEDLEEIGISEKDLDTLSYEQLSDKVIKAYGWVLDTDNNWSKKDRQMYLDEKVDGSFYEIFGDEYEEYAKGGLADNFDYMDLPITYTLTDAQGNLVLKTTSFNKAVDTRTLNSFTQKGKLKLVATDKSGNSKVISEGITEKGEVFAKGGQISTGDWVTYKPDGKRYKVVRVLNNNMLEIASGSNTLIVSMDDVETTTKFFRAKFVKVPTDVQVSYKIGDRVKFATKKGEEKGIIKLYKYIPTTNKIMYVIKTDSGWNANVYQDNVSLESSASAPIKSATPKAPRKTTKPIASGLTKGDKVIVKDAPSLSGTVTEVLSNDMVNVDVQDSLGITMKVGVVSNMTFSKSELQKA